MKKFSFLLILLLFPVVLGAQIDSIVNELPRPTGSWETGFQSRINDMWSTRVPAYTVNPNDGSEDGGKWQWPRFLSRMAWPSVNYNQTTMASFVALGKQMINGSNVGSFEKPFSCAGYAMYYFKWKDTIATYEPTQIGTIQSDVNFMWRYLVRQDHVFDACCGYNDDGGKEFNSENFHWMMRAAGYLFAHELHNKTISGTTYDMTKKYVSSILLHTGLSSPKYKYVTVSEFNLIDYFDGYLKNLTRAMYNAGRVEWNSNAYFGHTLNPLLTIYDGAERCGDPNGAANKKRAQACVDWMMVEAAVRYLDGFQIAPDARAKDGSYRPFHGSYYQFTIPYFADDSHYPTFGKSVWVSQNPGEYEIGHLASSSYRPPQIAIDIANKKFPMPVEIQSAKPFYHIDFGTYLNQDGTIKGEFPYHDWNGTNRGRRFEFETIWMDENVTMASAAVGRPDGSIGTYSEQCTWRLGIKGQNFGARILSGNGGSKYSSAGRAKEVEIGQYRNMMMQMVKSSTVSYNKIWIAIPDNNNAFHTSGEGSFWDVQYYKWDNGSLYLDMGNDVYLAVKSYPTPTITMDTAFTEVKSYTKLTFSWAANTLGCIVLEVGTAREFGSFTNFYNTLASLSITNEGGDTYAYTGGMASEIKMQYQPLTTFLMEPYTADNFGTSPKTSGNYPMVWGDGVFIDYQSWDSYKTVYGYDLINQGWGSGVMELKTESEGARITIDPVTAEVTYEVNKKGATLVNNEKVKMDIVSKLFPNPTTDIIHIPNTNNEQVLIFNITGQLVKEMQVNNATLTVTDLPKGIYFISLNNQIMKFIKL